MFSRLDILLGYIKNINEQIENWARRRYGCMDRWMDGREEGTDGGMEGREGEREGWSWARKEGRIAGVRREGRDREREGEREGWMGEGSNHLPCTRRNKLGDKIAGHKKRKKMEELY